MTEELEQLLKNLSLRRILEIFEEQVSAAEKDDITYSDFLTRLVRAQWQARQEAALEWRIRRATCPSDGLWRRSPSLANQASTANRSAPSPSWTSLPKAKILFWSGRLASAKLASPVAYC
jgi:hypothetical protein